MKQQNKSQFKFRWILLIISVWINTAAYYVYDHPTALHNTLKERFDGRIDGDVFEIYFGGLYSVYAVANIFLPLISGRMRDNMGDRVVLVFLCCLMIIGQSIFIYGISIYNFWIMYLGRAIVGWGIESCLASQCSLLSPYFRVDYMVSYNHIKSTVVGINQFMAMLGAMLALWILPIINDIYGFFPALMTGVYFCLFALLCALISFVLDWIAEKDPTNIVYEGIGEFVVDDNLASIDISKAHAYDRFYWFMSLFMALIYMINQSLSNVSVGLISERWYPDDEKAEIKIGQINGIAWGIAAVSTPLLGYSIDKVGQRALFTVLTAMISILSQLILWHKDPQIALILVGLSFGMAYAVIWSAIINTVSENMLGYAFSFIISLQSIGMVIGPMTIGILRSFSGTYYYSILFLIFCGLLAFILSILIFVEDHKRNNAMDQGIENQNQ